MTTTQIIIIVAGVLYSLSCVFVGIIWTMIIDRIKKVEASIIDHDRRIQKIEDVHENKIDELGRRIDKLEQSIKDLATQVHKEKNTETALNATLNALIKQFEKTDEINELLLKRLNHDKQHQS